MGGDLPPDRYFALGGPGSFPGFELGENRVSGYWTASTGYRWKFKDIMSIRGQALYAGISVEAGATYQDFSTPFYSGDYRRDLYGGSIYLTGRTLVGPLTLGVGSTNTDSWSLWLSVGRPIGRGTILEKGIFR
jgi:hypothetical protein